MVYLLFVFISYINAKEDPTEICINNESAISGCTFSNIKRENSSYFIKLDKEILFYGNNFDFSTFDYNPIPVYLSNIFQGKITVSQCSFVKCNSIESDANALICNGEVDITIENCQFINCGENISHAIVKLNSNNEHLMNFTNCIFHFDNENSSCYVFKTKCSVRLIFDHCKFIKCPIIKTNHKIHSLQFTYNVVHSANRLIVFINYLEFELNIKSNVFKNNNNLISSGFITLKHDLNEIALINNTFSDISSDKSFYVFSTILYFKRITKLKSYIVICECKFINIQNKDSAIMIGGISKTVNIKLNLTNSEFIDNLCINGNGGALSVNNNQELSIINCYFKNNKASHHGGAISLYIATKVDIVSCTFEDNIANYAPSFMHDLKKCKGGAIYMYCNRMKGKCPKIEKCMFISNSAYDGYAIYIKGDANQQDLIIIQNTFKDNYDKNSNTRNKSIITSKILLFDVDKIIFSNKFMPKEENKQRLVFYIDLSNQKKCKYSYSRIIVTMLNLIFIFALIIISIFATRNFDQDNTFVFVILGDQAIKHSQLINEKNVIKYSNYCLSSLAILIKRLAIKHLGINEKHVGIFGKGQSKDFDISSIVQNNKIVSQITIDEIYETETTQSELNFLSFQNVEELIGLMLSFISKSNCLEPNIIIFMYDHGDENSFSNLKFLELYLGLLSIPHSSLHIYNQSCKSKSMLLKIKNYFKISEVINSFTPKIIQDELFFLASIGNKIFPKGNYSQWDSILELDNRYSEYNSQRKCNAIQLLLSLVFDKDKKYDKFPSNFTRKEIIILTEIVKCYLLYNNIPTDYDEIHSIISKGIRVIIGALKKFEITNAELMNILNDLKEYKSNFAEEQYEMHPNHFIITSSHEKNSSPTFGTIKLDERRKIIAGSPAMGAYIIEALINRSLSKNSVDSIKRIVYGDAEGFIREYATENTNGRTKQWVCLTINYWESNIISEEKIFLNQDINYMEIKGIMKSIGYKLIACCKLEFNEKNNCITKKMQPLFNSQRTPNYIGVRLININQHYDFNKTIFEEDGYYSNDSYDKPEGSNNQSNYLDYSSNFSSTSSFDNFLDDMDYDMVIPHKYIVKISYEAIKEFMSYPVRIVTVFEYELNEMSKNEKFLTKYSSNNNEITEKMPYEFKLMIYNWIMHFLPTYELRELIDDFVLLFYKFTVKFDIPTKDAESIFYKCMNIADQVASQLSCIDKMKAYYDERLKK